MGRLVWLRSGGGNGLLDCGRRRSRTGGQTCVTFRASGSCTSLITDGNTTSYTFDPSTSLPLLLDDGQQKYVWGAVAPAYAKESVLEHVYEEEKRAGLLARWPPCLTRYAAVPSLPTSH